MSQTADKYALGVVNMLRHAIHEHKREHNGKSPKRFELHPEVFADLRCALMPMMMYSFASDMPMDGIEFYGVRVVEDEQATQPKLINCRNEVIYL